MSKNIRKAFIKDFVITLKIKHDQKMPNVHHLKESIGEPEKVLFNVEVGYYYEPVNFSSSIDDVFEYSFICRHLRNLQDTVHTCILENLLEEITAYIFSFKNTIYVKSELLRQQIVPEGFVGIGLEKYKKENHE